MITSAQILVALAGALETDAGLAAASATFGKPARVLVGNDGTAPQFPEDNALMIAVYHGESAVDYGDTADARDFAIGIRWAGHDPTATDDGRRVTFAGTLTADAIGAAIVAAVRTWTESAGGILASFPVKPFGSALWPMCGGDAVATLRFIRTCGTPEPELAAAAITETPN